MRIPAALLGLGAALVQFGTGCVPLGGCGGVDQTTDLVFALQPDGAVTATDAVGVAGDGAALWVAANRAGGVVVDHYPAFGAAPDRSLTIATDAPAAGLAWDGEALWLGLGDHALRVDAATGEPLRDVALPMPATDLGWDVEHQQLLVAEGVGAVEGVDPTSGQVLRSIPVRTANPVGAVAWDGQLWASSTVADDALLVFGGGDVLYANVIAPADAVLAHMTFVDGDNGREMITVAGGELRRYIVLR